MNDIDRLRAFANEIIDEYQLDIEGVQDIAVKHGLLAPVTVTEPCRPETCHCADYGFPTECYHKTAALTEARAENTRLRGTA